MSTIVDVADMLTEAAQAARRAYAAACARMTADERQAKAGIGADGTETFLLDVLVEEPVLDVLAAHRVNVLSEEAGWIDRGSAVTVAIDPVDGTANAAAGVPLSCFAAALVVDDTVQEALVVWLETGRRWAARRDVHGAQTASRRRSLDGASISMLRPRPANRATWQRIAERVERIRILGTSVLEAALVADGAIDAFCDPGGDIHRIVDVAATQLIVEQAGGCAIDAFGRPFHFTPDLSLRWSGVFAGTPDLAAELANEIATAR